MGLAVLMPNRERMMLPMACHDIFGTSKISRGNKILEEWQLIKEIMFLLVNKVIDRSDHVSFLFALSDRVKSDSQYRAESFSGMGGSPIG